MFLNLSKNDGQGRIAQANGPIFKMQFDSSAGCSNGEGSAGDIRIAPLHGEHLASIESACALEMRAFVVAVGADDLFRAKTKAMHSLECSSMRGWCRLLLGTPQLCWWIKQHFL